MKNLTKTLLGAMAIAGSFAAAPAYAQDAAPDFSLSGVATVQSDYRFRGISQNGKEATPEFGLTLTGPDGWYLSGWTAKTNWGGNNPSFELDIFGGKHFDLGGTDLNIMAYYYAYPDYRTGGGAGASFYETIVQLSHAFGPLTLTLTGANSPEFSLGGGAGWYVAGTAAFAVTDWLTFSGTVGNQSVDAAPASYTHFDIGATAVWHAWSFDVRYVGSDIGAAACTGFWMGGTTNACSGGFVGTVNLNVTDLLK